MKTLIPVIVEELQAGRMVALATVLQEKGSAPRSAGACLLLLQSGRALGTVGGGVLERRALDESKALLARALDGKDSPYTMPFAVGFEGAESHVLCSTECSLIQEYALTQDDVQSLGMVCGGNVSLLYQALTPDMFPFFHALQTRLGEGRNLWLIRRLVGGSVTHMALSNGLSISAPFPQDLLSLLCNRKPTLSLAGHKPSSANSATSGWFAEPIVRVSHAYIFGGGHVAQCVAPLLAQLTFSPIVYDDRLEFSSPDLFPCVAGTVCAPFAEMSERLTISADDEIVIMTRGHANDLMILTQALRTSAYYIGLIGSRSKIAYTRSMLLQQGFTEADFARVHTPIGLPIKAETPMEIAVSVAAEMIRSRAEHAEADNAG